MTNALLADAEERLTRAGKRVELFLRYDKDGKEAAVAAAKEIQTTPLSLRLEVCSHVPGPNYIKI